MNIPRSSGRMNGLSLTGVSLSGLSDMQKLFVLEYFVDGNATEAAKRAGYSPRSAAATAGGLLAKPKIRKIVEKISRKLTKKYEIERHEILQELYAMCMRSGADLVDKQGVLRIENVRRLPENVQKAIDGIEQRVKRYTNEDGTVEYEILHTKVKLVPKAQAIEMAMRHKGLFAAEVHKHELKIDLDNLNAIIDEHQNTIEGKVQKALEVPEGLDEQATDT